MEGTVDEPLVKDPAEDAKDILKGGGADILIPNGLNGQCDEENDESVDSKNLNEGELLNDCDDENKEPSGNEEDENMEVDEYNDEVQENNADVQENNTDSTNECNEKSEDKSADSDLPNNVKNVDNVKTSENVNSEVSDKNGNHDKECNKKDDFVESMEVDGKSNGSDVECLDENELLASDNEDNLSNRSKTPQENNKNSSAGNKNKSAEIIEDSLDASDVKICEENGSIGSSDVEEVTDGAKSNGQNDDDLLVEERTPKKKTVKKIDLSNITPRRSSRNIKRTSYTEKEAEERDDGSDIEEIKPVDPLAELDHPKDISKFKPSILKNISPSNSKTIVVNDTKRLVEIAAGSKSTKGSKKEPTLVIIDTNSILSGRGGIPVSSTPKSVSQNSSHYQHSSHSISTSSSFSMVPIGVNSQTMYHHNMRTTITPVPLTSKTTHLNPKTTISPILNVPQTAQPVGPQILPTLTDDMFVVEAPSFIVPYVYEKPPIKPLADFVKKLKKSIQEVEKEEKIRKEKEKAEKAEKSEEANNSDSDYDEKKDIDEVNSTIDLTDKDSNQEDSYEDNNKLKTYFDLPLGKFFMQIGMNLVQEFVQTDLLRTQKRKQSKGGSTTVETQMAINSLIKNLEYSKENNEPFHLDLKKCEFCNFKTESSLVMQHHMETPHMRNYMYKCNFCPAEVRSPHEILFHMEEEHNTRGRLERGPAFHQCPNCPFEDNQKGKLSRHILACTKKFRPERNLEPSLDWEPPAKIPRMNRPRAVGPSASASAFAMALPPKNPQPLLPKLLPAPVTGRGRGRPPMQPRYPEMKIMRPGGASTLRPENLSMMYRPTSSGLLMPTSYQLSGNQIFQNTSMTVKNPAAKLLSQPSISITPLPRTASQQSPSAGAGSSAKPGGKTTFVICEICDGYIKDLEQLRNHMQWIHKVKIHPKMIYNRPPLNCQKCQFRFFTDQGLERHLLGSHGLVTSSMQEAANKGKDAGRCPACGRVFQWKLLNHVARDHGMTLKPAHLSYKCTVCTATFGMYKQFENHVYSAHSVVAKRVMDKKSTPSPSSRSNDSLLKPLKINDEITIIPQPAKLGNRSSGSQNRGK